ncbi:MATE family efflux transporter [Paraphotobacterium marinum]|uniref:MATE family efflux transporter n=1 Tax=Paraphotobacterium marinum TaxID=1755811 RepID=UPI0039E95AC7
MKKILPLAIPLILSQLIQQLMLFTDIWMFSRIGINEMAAGGLGAQVFSIIFIIAASIIGCSANLISISYGKLALDRKKAEKEISMHLKGSILLTLIFTFFLMVIFIYIPNLMIQFGQKRDVVILANEYLSALKWSIFPSLMIFVLRALSGSYGKVKSIMILSLVTVMLNIPLTYVFAFYLKMGISGVGWGTTVANFTGMIGYGFWLFRQNEFTKFSLLKNLDEYKISSMKPILYIGLPIAIATVLEYGLIASGTFFVGVLGVAALATQQILLQCLNFSYNVSYGLAQASAIISGRNYGQNNINEISNVTKKTILMVTISSGLFALFFNLNPNLLLDIFDISSTIRTQEFLDSFQVILVVMGLTLVADAWQISIISILRSMKIVKIPTFITMIGYWLIGIPVSYALMTFFGVVGVWSGICLGLLVTSILLYLNYHKSTVNLKLCHKQETEALI